MKASSRFIAIILLPLTLGHAAEPPGDAQAAADKLLAAVISVDYPAFVADAAGALKKVEKKLFTAVSDQLRPRLKKGYSDTYLGALNQNGYQVTLRRLRFTDGGDDALVTLKRKDGKNFGYSIKIWLN